MKFLVVDDHAVVREGLSAVLRHGVEGATVIHAGDSETALARAGEHPDLDVVFLDLVLPRVSGMEALDAFGRLHPDLPVVVLSSSEAASDVRSALAHGALGFIPKSATPTTLLAALRLVLDGEVYVPPFVMSGSHSLHAGGGERSGGLAGLTERQAEVLALISEDIANKEIAYQLGLSEKTVKAHVTAILRSLNVANRAQAANIARDARRVSL